MKSQLLSQLEHFIPDADLVFGVTFLTRTFLRAEILSSDTEKI